MRGCSGLIWFILTATTVLPHHCTGGTMPHSTPLTYLTARVKCAAAVLLLLVATPPRLLLYCRSPFHTSHMYCSCPQCCYSQHTRLGPKQQYTWRPARLVYGLYCCCSGGPPCGHPGGVWQGAIHVVLGDTDGTLRAFSRQHSRASLCWEIDNASTSDNSISSFGW
jgi:hypothetical protein